MEFRECVLENGLNIVAECNPKAHTTAIGFFVNTGSRDETDEVAGVSHFLEHMVFKGTPTRSADDVNREFDEMGADYNAYTSDERTVYYATVLPEMLERTIRLWGDVMRPSLREEDFNTEKKVIIEEIQMYADQPPFNADDVCKANHFGDHPLSRSILGTVESVEKLRVDQMRDYFAARYSPANITLVGSGRVDFDQMVRCAKEVCGGWENTGAGRQTARHSGSGRFEAIEKASATHEYFLLLSNGPSAADDDRIAAKLMAAILGDDSGSRLYWELIDPGLAEHAGVSHESFQGTGLFSAFLSCDPQRAETNMQKILDVFHKAESEGITQDELDIAKSKFSSRIVLTGERPRGRLFNVGVNWNNLHEYRDIRKDLDMVAAVTVEQINAVLRKYPLSQYTAIAVGPLRDIAAPK